MNKKMWVSLLIGCCLIAAILFSGVGKSIALFLLLGIVPGTNLVLSPILMLCLMMALAWIVAMHITGKLAETAAFRQQVKKYIARKNRLPKRRYAVQRSSQSAK